MYKHLYIDKKVFKGKNTLYSCSIKNWLLQLNKRSESNGCSRSVYLTPDEVKKKLGSKI